ncbi:MAG: hypothetical protein M3Z32_06855 [Acidobacteriota bacterium]|nr:hypothetical protein [Acidobacteriota bacterium]
MLRFIPLILAAIAAAAFAQNSTLTVSPSPLILCGQPNQAVSGAPLFVSTPSGSLTFVATAVTSEGEWLQVEPNFSTVTAGQPSQLLVGINPGGQTRASLYNSIIPFSNGEYTGQIILSDVNGAKLATVPVSLRVSAAGCGDTKSGSIYVNSGPLTFQVPPATATGITSLLFNSFRTNVTVVPTVSTGSAQKWITSVNTNLYIVTGSMYPTPLVVGVSTDGLSPGTSYTGNIEFDSSSYSILNFPITLNVSANAGSARFAATPSPVSVSIPRDTTGTSVNIALTNLTPTAVGISVAPTTVNGRNWLAVSPAAAVLQPNESISLAANIAASGLADGANNGSVNVQVTSGSSGSLVIPVTVKKGIGSELSATPNPLNFTTSRGSSTPVQDVISVESSSGAISFSTKAFSSVNQPWLAVKPFSSTASPGSPVNLVVSVNPALVPDGPAVGIITLVHSDGSTALTIPVNVNAGNDTALGVTPAQLSFSYPFGSPFPQTQTISLTGPAATNYTVQSSTAAGGKWLVATPNSVSTGPSGSGAKITVQVNPGGLAPNTYVGQVAVTNTNTGAQQIIPVTVTVGPALPVSASPASLLFNYQAGSPQLPPPQAVQISSTGGSSGFTATAAGLNDGPDFLTVNAPNGNTPATLLVGVNASSLGKLSPGEYPGVVTISSPGIPGGSQVVSVRLIVSQPPPRIAALVSSASLSPDPVSPGEMVTVFGSALAGSTLTFDGYSAPLIYVGGEQINAIVPYEIAGRTVTSVVATKNGVASSPVTIPVTDTAPAIFTTTQNGSGQGAILNADNSYNSSANPASKGSVIQIFATGEGLYPGAVSGSVVPSLPPFPALSAPVRVTIGGVPADLLYSSEAPGLLSGTLQVNAIVPETAGSGPQKVVLSIGANSNSSQNVTVAVQ